jgi:hypothetical protein
MSILDWQSGLFLGAAFTIVLDFGVRALLWRLRLRKALRCSRCTGILGDEGRAEFPVESLECCAWCGDTWPHGKRPEYEPPAVGYRDSAKDPLLEIAWSSDPELRALQKLTHHLAPVPSRPVPGSGKQRYGSGLQYGYRPPPDPPAEPPPDPPAELPPPRRVSECVALPLPRPPKRVLR